MSVVYIPNRTIALSSPVSRDLRLDLLGKGKKYAPVAYTKRDDDYESQKWKIKNLEEKGGSGEFVIENVAVPGTYLTVSALAEGAPLYGSPNATVWVRVDNGKRKWFATADGHYPFFHACPEVEFSPAILARYYGGAVTTSPHAAFRAGEHEADIPAELLSGPADE